MQRSGSLLLALLCGGCAHGSMPDGPAPAPAPPAPAAIETLHLDAPGVADAPLRVRAYLPPGYDPRAGAGYPVLYVNDGQDMEAVGLEATLASLHADGAIRPLIVVAIDMPPDRMAAYGLSDRARGISVVAPTKYGPVGAKAHAYSEWLARTLVPAIDRRYHTRAAPDGRALLGWSLGALHAFGMGWQYPEVFGRVGAFSPSFWLSAEGGDASAVQRTRLAQRMVDVTARPDGVRFYFAVGTAEDTDDRDGDGTNDALDDTRDLIAGWSEGGVVRAKGLRQRGYAINLDQAATPGDQEAVLAVLEGGRHQQSAWARMLPGFLAWAYAGRADAPLR